MGLINYGISTNVLPDRVTMRLDPRSVPEENGQQVTNELIRVVNEAVKSLPGITCATRTIMLVEPLVPLSRQDRLVAAIKSNADRLIGEPIPAMGAPIYTAARQYCAAGVPTVLYGAGPRLPSDANTHGPNERLKLSDLPLASEIVALACYDLLAKGN